jgi:RNA polymerase sigma-70 factor (ECF subfamily)
LLDGLDDRDRALFVLRHVEKLELTEVAAALAWSRSKTKRRLLRVTGRVTRLKRCDPALADYVTAAATRTANTNRNKGEER